ncbi:hypothetical protein ACRTDU_05750 [Sunxiuqinia elliptica]
MKVCSIENIYGSIGNDSSATENDCYALVPEAYSITNRNHSKGNCLADPENSRAAQVLYP